MTIEEFAEIMNYFLINTCKSVGVEHGIWIVDILSKIQY